MGDGYEMGLLNALSSQLSHFSRYRMGNKSFRCVSSRPVIEHSIKIAKKLKKLENTILAFLQAKIG